MSLSLKPYGWIAFEGSPSLVILGYQDALGGVRFTAQGEPITPVRSAPQTGTWDYSSGVLIKTMQYEGMVEEQLKHMTLYGYSEFYPGYVKDDEGSVTLEMGGE